MSSDTSSAKPLSGGLNFQLSTMMFLQYAIWGAWLPLLWPFLSGHRGFSPSEIGNMFAIGAVGAIVAPFIAGQIADRWFNTEKFLGISHILGGILVWQLASLETYNSFLVFSLLYSLIYSPTLSLTNSLAFHHLVTRSRGTIGWIVWPMVGQIGHPAYGASSKPFTMIRPPTFQKVGIRYSSQFDSAHIDNTIFQNTQLMKKRKLILAPFKLSLKKKTPKM